jgi:hypothetical protein
VKFKNIVLVAIILMVIMIPAVYAYTDPVSVAIIWQFLASALVGLVFFFKRIKFWFKNKFKSKKEVK